MKKDDFGSFDIVIPAQDGQPAIPHNSKLKVGFFISRISTKLYLTHDQDLARPAQR